MGESEIKDDPKVGSPGDEQDRGTLTSPQEVEKRGRVELGMPMGHLL